MVARRKEAEAKKKWYEAKIRHDKITMITSLVVFKLKLTAALISKLVFQNSGSYWVVASILMELIAFIHGAAGIWWKPKQGKRFKAATAALGILSTIAPLITMDFVGEEKKVRTSHRHIWLDQHQDQHDQCADLYLTVGSGGSGVQVHHCRPRYLDHHHPPHHDWFGGEEKKVRTSRLHIGQDQHQDQHDQGTNLYQTISNRDSDLQGHRLAFVGFFPLVVLEGATTSGGVSWGVIDWKGKSWLSVVIFVLKSAGSVIKAVTAFFLLLGKREKAGIEMDWSSSIHGATMAEETYVDSKTLHELMIIIRQHRLTDSDVRPDSPPPILPPTQPKVTTASPTPPSSRPELLVEDLDDLETELAMPQTQEVNKPEVVCGLPPPLDVPRRLLQVAHWSPRKGNAALP